MKAPGVDLTTATTSVRNAQLQTESKCHCYSDGLVVKTQTAAGNWQHGKPVSCVWSRRSQECGLLASAIQLALNLQLVQVVRQQTWSVQADCLWDAEPTGGKLKVDDQIAL